MTVLLSGEDPDSVRIEQFRRFDRAVFEQFPVKGNEWTLGGLGRGEHDCIEWIQECITLAAVGGDDGRSVRKHDRRLSDDAVLDSLDVLAFECFLFGEDAPLNRLALRELYR